MRLLRAGSDLLLDEVSLDDAKSRICCRRTVVRDGKVRECRWPLRLVAPTEYEQWLGEAGFARVRFLGDDGEEHDGNRRRLLVVAHAPG